MIRRLPVDVVLSAVTTTSRTGTVFSSLLSRCTTPHRLRQLHAQLVAHGLTTSTPLLTEVTLLYLSFSLLDAARLLFLSFPIPPSSYLSNTIIRCFSTSGDFHTALSLYSSMLASPVSPDKFTFPFVLKSCAGLGDLWAGKVVHRQCLHRGCGLDVYVGAALVDMYAKCGRAEDARKVFDRMLARDLVCWTSMISGYAHNGYSNEALDFFSCMMNSDMKPSRVALLSALLACGHLGAVRKGESFHDHTIKTGFENDVLVATAIIDMYAKCGSMDLARFVFDHTHNKDVVCWSSMIASYGFYGLGREAINVFNLMVEAHVKPNHVTFTSILSACSHSGLLEEGEMYFNLMSDLYGVSPRLNHYSCMVDLLGRAGRLLEAEKLIEKIPMAPDSSLWGSLLAACRIHGNDDLGERAADHIFQLGATNSGYYVLLSNIYAAKSRWKDVEKVRELMTKRKLKKNQGLSLIEFSDCVHKFGVGDQSHPQSDEIYKYLGKLAAPLKQQGYVPLIDFVLHDIEDEAREAALSCHSERLAIGFGLINVRPGVPIRVTKNLRICGDCHNWTKMVSKVTSRVIIVRDMKRFHCFEGGICSCGDYW